MIASARRYSSFARYRLAASCSVAAVPATGDAACRISAPIAVHREGIERKQLCAIALAVLGLHGLLAIEAFRAFESKTTASEPSALDVRLNVLAPPRAPALAAPALSPSPGRNASKATQTPPSPSTPPHARRSTAALIRPAPSPAATRTSQAAHDPANPPSSLAAPSGAPPATQTTPQTTPQTAPQHDAGAAPPSAKPSASGSESENAAAQPATAPSFNAAYLHNPPPAYPAMAQRRAWEGTVLLKVHVLANGKPDHIEVVSSSGHPPLDEAAQEAVNDWRFIPAKRAAQAVDGWVQVPIEFKLGT
ncbi:TonB family protein [Trinickia violacea]|uniref:TonB family protein n=1 Tax=Trinickia violacea TaxID=2571746 RepID=A0A4P8ILS2_9BURK|nr:energy transducer TonB [Trinickia violacea]QCP49868.1 TonB family protein [Trinickia violacea]